MFLVAAAVSACGPEPPVWPAKFVLEQRKIPDDDSGNSSVVTYYDTIKGANLLLIAPDKNRSDVLWDLELNTKHSFYFLPSRRTCKPIDFPVGILDRNWLSNSTYLGIRPCPFGSPSSRCAAWTKAKFINYFADADTCEPRAWWFWTMKATFVTVNFTANASAPEGYFTPPDYCMATKVSARQVEP